MDPLKTDCRHFRPDRPCAPHKQHGVICATCTDDYDPIRTRILIVKMAAVGDVLRTTSLLPGIVARWPGAHITWVTSPAAAPLFSGNRLVDRVLTFSGHVPVELLAERFDVVINPDAAADACALAHLARCEERIGFDVDERGAPIALSPAAERWLEMGVRDDLKKANTLTYQEHMAAILGVDYRRDPPILELDEADRTVGASLMARHPGSSGKLVIGLNTGAGGRWRFKRWTEEGYVELSRQLVADGHQVLLLGGPEEVERNARLAASVGEGVIETGCDNTLREFAGIVELCDVVVTGDTLAMHVAIARGCRVVVLFGPTSLNEIEVFDRGDRIAPDLPCLVCYKQDCDLVPNCMKSIGADRVLAAVLGQGRAALDGKTANGRSAGS
jgi:heptosyltransferase-2